MERQERSLTEKERNAIQKVVLYATDDEKTALNSWAKQVLKIRQSDNSRVNKGIEAIRLTANSNIIIPILKIIAKELNLDQLDASKVRLTSKKPTFQSVKQFWGRRSLRMKIGLSAASITTILFGGQSAGVAALGTAIGLPLWAVFGGGAIVLTVLIEEITGKTPDITTNFEAVEAKESAIREFLNKLLNLRKK